MLRNAIGFMLLVSLPAAVQADGAGNSGKPPEISGIDRHGDTLYLVNDEVVGRVFSFSIKGKADQRVFALAPLGTARELPGGDGDDLEAVRYHPDAGPIVLSEKGPRLISLDWVMEAFPNHDPNDGKVDYKEFCNSGLEGFDLKPDGGTYKFVVLHEGGYPERDDCEVIDSDEWKRSRLPFVSTFNFDPQTGLPAQPEFSNPIQLDLVDLHRNFVDPILLDESEPYAQRFRAPAILWHEVHPASYIVLLSSANEPLNNTGERPCKREDREVKRFSFKLLQRFDADGRPVGCPINLDANPDIIQAGLAGPCRTNWEGMAWFEPGRSVIIVNDEFPKDRPPTAVVIDLPPDWQ